MENKIEEIEDISTIELEELLEGFFISLTKKFKPKKFVIAYNNIARRNNWNDRIKLKFSKENKNHKKNG